MDILSQSFSVKPSSIADAPNFAEHDSWTKTLKALASLKGVSDICLNNLGRIRIKGRGLYLSPALNPKLLGSNGWRELCQVIHPDSPDLAIDENYRENGCSIGNHRLRVSRVRASFGEEFTLRVLPKIAPKPEDLLLPADLVERFVQLTSGLVLFAGATGNGKSTSIASLLLENAKRRQVRIITIEDPVEFEFQDLPNGSTFTSIAVGPHTCTFASALKRALRMHADIIMVGEIRDSSEAEVALEASLTGAKVVSTIHGTDVGSAMQRMGDLVAEIGSSGAGALAMALSLCVAQKLLYPKNLPRAVVPIHEILTRNDSVSFKIRGARYSHLKQDMEVGANEGMQLFEQSRLKRINDGLL